MNDTSPGQPKIALAGVTKSFEDNHVLKGIDLDVRAGESLVLIGPSGCGKTVALKCVIGLMNPDAGSIRIDGRETAGLSEGQRQDDLARTGMLFQRSALFDSMNIWRNITFRLTQTRDIGADAARDFAIRKLADVGLGADVADLYPVELSGGMQKRVGIARAIADEPEILLLDEPTAGLDPIMTQAINDLVLENAERLGATILSITSDMDGARAIADRIAMIYEGRIIWCGPKDDADDSGNPYVDQFIHRRSEGPIEMVLE
jgi:phospholipid/cholesterol/gamma-HCH transport system ATP-binding protein